MESKYPRARTSKQKRGLAFIQDGLTFARVRYSEKSDLDSTRIRRRVNGAI